MYTLKSIDNNENEYIIDMLSERQRDTERLRDTKT